MDTIIFVAMVGSSLAMALLFASTVLSHKERGMMRDRNHSIGQGQLHMNRSLVNCKFRIANNKKIEISNPCSTQTHVILE